MIAHISLPPVKIIVISVYSQTKGVETTAEVSLIVFTIGFTLCIQNSRPVFSFKVKLGIDVNLNLDRLFVFLYRISWDTRGSENCSEEFSNSGWTPVSYNFSSFQIELGTKNRILDGSVRVHFTKRNFLPERDRMSGQAANPQTMEYQRLISLHT